VGQKTTKEKFMKKKLIIMLIVLFTFSLTFIACTEEDTTDPDLNGKWKSVDETETITFDNGTVIWLDGVEPFLPIKKGEFTTKGDNDIEIKVIEIRGDALAEVGLSAAQLSALAGHDFTANKWYREDDIIFSVLGINDATTLAVINKIFGPKTGIYFINGTKLTIIYNKVGVDGGTYTDMVDYTK
jgi:hypothetical protein